MRETLDKLSGMETWKMSADEAPSALLRKTDAVAKCIDQTSLCLDSLEVAPPPPPPWAPKAATHSVATFPAPGTSLVGCQFGFIIFGMCIYFVRGAAQQACMAHNMITGMLAVGSSFPIHNT